MGEFNIKPGTPAVPAFFRVQQSRLYFCSLLFSTDILCTQGLLCLIFHQMDVTESQVQNKLSTYPKFQTVTAGNTRGNTRLFAKQFWPVSITQCKRPMLLAP